MSPAEGSRRNGPIELQAVSGPDPKTWGRRASTGCGELDLGCEENGKRQLRPGQVRSIQSSSPGWRESREGERKACISVGALPLIKVEPGRQKREEEAELPSCPRWPSSYYPP